MPSSNTKGRRPQRSGSVSVQMWLRELRKPFGMPSVKGELAKSAVATGCNARLTRNFFTMSDSEAKSRFTCTVQVLSIMSRPSLPFRSEEHTSELKSLMRISYSEYALKKLTYKTHKAYNITANK